MDEIVLSDATPSALQLRRLVKILRDDNDRLTQENRDLRLRLMVYENADTLKKRFLTVEIIQDHVANYFGLTINDIKGTERPNHIVYPRHIAMMLCRAFTRLSLEQVGMAFGGRGHATVINACRNVENLMVQDAKIRDNVEMLRKSLCALAGVHTSEPK